MGDRRAAVTAVAAVLGGVVLVAVLVTWAASIGPSGVLTGEGLDPVRLTPTETSSPADPFAEPSLRTDDQDRLAERYAGDRPWLRATVAVLEVAVVVALVLLLYRGGRRAFENWRARQRPPAEDPEVDFELLGDPRRALVEQMDRDVEDQRAALVDGTPRNGIVACWHRFEHQAAEAGLPRHPWETSSEFTLRMLDLAGADAHAVHRLAALYREARFSEHEVDEALRTQAMDALAEVHRGVFGRTT